MWRRAALLLLLQLLFAASMAVAAGRAPSSAHGLQCERITVPACQGLGYNMTALPDGGAYADQAEASLVIAQLQPLLDSGCSKHIRFLVCATIFPLCTPDVSRPVAACRSLCQTVRHECLGIPAATAAAAAAQQPFEWPAFIDCDTLPQPERQELCMQVPQNDTAAVAAANVSSAVEAELPNLVESFPPSADASAPASIWPWMSRPPSSGGGPMRGTPLIPPVMSPVICAANFTPVSAHRCGPLAGTDALFTPHQKRIAGTWTLALAALCFILTLFSLVTFWAEPMRFGYPERPVLFLALCYNLLSVAYLERAIFHQQLQHQHLMPAQQQQQQQQQHQVDTSSSSAVVIASMGSGGFGSVNIGGGGGGLTCPASFLLVGYLQLAAAEWWFLFAVCWWLSTARQWSSEALERRATLLHVMAWCPAAVPPVAAVLWDAVRPNELTGMCTARGWIELPAAVLLVAGAGFVVAASRSLGGMRRRRAAAAVSSTATASAEHDDGGADAEWAAAAVVDEVAALAFQKRLAQIRQRIVVFSGVFFVPAVAAVALGFVETGYVTIEACVLGDPCVAAKRWPAWPTLLRLFVTLAGGSLAGMWVWSKKTCESYRTRMAVVASASGAAIQGHHYQHQQQQHHQRQHLGSGGVVVGAGSYLVRSAGKAQHQRNGGGKKMSRGAWMQQQHQQLLQQQQQQQLQSQQRPAVGPLYAGISFDNVPVYSVRAPMMATEREPQDD